MIDEGRSAAAYLYVGYPARLKSKPELENLGWLNRPPLSDVVFDETWNGKVAEH